MALASCGGSGGSGSKGTQDPVATGGALATGGAPATGGTAPATGGSTTGGVATGGTSVATGGTAAGSAGVAGGGAAGASGAGAGGEVAGNGGSGGVGTGGTATALAGPILRGGKAVLEFGDIYFEVDPAVGARVTSVKVGALELLSSKSVNADNYGSTFWTSPQFGATGWNWPPVPEVDSAAYTLAAEQTSAVAVGPKVSAAAAEPVRDLSVSKKFSPDFAKRAVIIEYTLKNEGTVARQVAPWEITRVGVGGLTFFAAESAPVAATGEGAKPLTATTLSDGAYWFDYPATQPETKLLANGKGWLAHVTADGLLLIKTFDDLTAAELAPNESEVELYTNASSSPADGYVEVENQGPYVMIPAGGSSSWSVTWYLRTLPATMMAAPGKPLVDLVTATIE